MGRQIEQTKQEYTQRQAEPLPEPIYCRLWELLVHRLIHRPLLTFQQKGWGLERINFSVE